MAQLYECPDIVLELINNLDYYSVIQLACVSSGWKHAIMSAWDRIVDMHAPLSVWIKHVTNEDKLIRQIQRRMADTKIKLDHVCGLLYIHRRYKVIIHLVKNMHWFPRPFVGHIFHDDTSINEDFKQLIHSVFHDKSEIKASEFIDLQDDFYHDRYLYVCCYLIIGPHTYTVSQMVSTLITHLRLTRSPYTRCIDMFMVYFDHFKDEDWDKYLAVNIELMNGPEAYNRMSVYPKLKAIIDRRIDRQSPIRLMYNAFYPVATFKHALQKYGTTIDFEPDVGHYSHAKAHTLRQMEYFTILRSIKLQFTMSEKEAYFKILGAINFPWMKDMDIPLLRKSLSWNMQDNMNHNNSVIKELKSRGHPVDLSDCYYPTNDSDESIDPDICDIMSCVDSEIDMTRAPLYLNRVVKRFPYIRRDLCINKMTISHIFDYWGSKGDAPYALRFIRKKCKSDYRLFVISSNDNSLMIISLLCALKYNITD